MRKEFWTILAVMLLAIFSASRDGRATPFQGEIPPGSYRQSCFSYRVQGNTLTAMCQSLAGGLGGLKAASLSDYKSCTKDIANVNGVLTCIKASEPSPPRGPYEQSCAGSRMSDGVLHSICKSESGEWRATQLNDVKSCLSEVTNMDGVLTCERAGVPAGSYRESCRNISRQHDVAYTHDVLMAECKNHTGAWHYSSIELGKCRLGPLNIDGYLTCDKGDANPPSGTYRKSCRDLVVNGKTLTALCERTNGDWLQTTLAEFDKCLSEISNQDGTLQCARTFSLPPPQPPSSGRGVCGTLFIDTCQNPNGTPSDIVKRGSITVRGCGADLKAAEENAKRNLGANFQLADRPTPGQCTYHFSAR